MSRFGELVKALRLEQNLTMEMLAKRLGTHKGYISGIESGKVNPPSVKVIQKYAKVLGQEATRLVRIAWVDKAPALIRSDAERFLRWCEEGMPGAGEQPRK